MGASTEYYRKNKAARDKKKAYDTKLGQRPAQVKKRTESNAKRREAKAKGQDIKNKDWDHSVKRFVKSSVNRGRTSGTKGDSNARGKKK